MRERRARTLHAMAAQWGHGGQTVAARTCQHLPGKGNIEFGDDVLEGISNHARHVRDQHQLGGALGQCIRRRSNRVALVEERKDESSAEFVVAHQENAW